MVEKLLPLLDAHSTSSLAQVHQLTADLLQNASFWKDLVMRSCPHGEKGPEDDKYDDHEFCNQVAEKFEEHRRVISHLAKLLTKMENPKFYLLELLHVICERHPPNLRRRFAEGDQLFQVSCPCQDTHSVSHLGFLILEEVEGALGSKGQKVEKVFVGYLQEPWLSALN